MFSSVKFIKNLLKSKQVKINKQGNYYELLLKNNYKIIIDTECLDIKHHNNIIKSYDLSRLDYKLIDLMLFVA